MSELLVRSRARHAYAVARSWSESWRGKAVTRVKSLPVQVRTQGLSLTVAVLLREGRSESGALAGALAEWLLDKSPYWPLGGLEGSQGVSATLLLDRAVNAESLPYRAAQTEAIAYLDVLKTLSDALYGTESEDAP